MNSRMSVSSCSVRLAPASPKLDPRCASEGGSARRHLLVGRPASRRRFRGAAGPARCAGDRSCAGRPPGSASRAGCRARPPRATAGPPRAAPPGPRPRRRRSRRSAGSPRREPAAPARAAGARQWSPGRRGRHSCSTGGALITSRTSIGMFIGTPPLPGAADARAAIS